MYKWIGAVFIVSGCTGFGFSLAAEHKRRERMVFHLIRALERMECELQYMLTPLPELCRSAAEASFGVIRRVFLAYSRELEERTMPDAASCMQAVVSKAGIPSQTIRFLLVQLGQSLGRFDLQGQLRGLEALRRQCEAELEHLSHQRNERLRCYKTLGICAGLALAILFI